MQTRDVKKAFNVKFRDVDWVDIFRFPSYTSGVYLTIYSLCVQSRLLTLFRIAHFTARSCFEGNYYDVFLYWVNIYRNPFDLVIQFVQRKQEDLPSSTSMPSAFNKLLSLPISSFSSRISLALESSLTMALQTICLALEN